MLQLYKFFKSQQYNFILLGNTKSDNTFFTEIKKSSFLLCWGCSFSKLEHTHEDKYLLSTKKKVFPKKKIWETGVPSIRLTKTYLLSMGGGYTKYGK